jgi:hypothetical protein
MTSTNEHLVSKSSGSRITPDMFKEVNSKKKRKKSKRKKPVEKLQVVDIEDEDNPRMNFTKQSKLIESNEINEEEQIKLSKSLGFFSNEREDEESFEEISDEEVKNIEVASEDNENNEDEKPDLKKLTVEFIEHKLSMPIKKSVTWGNLKSD